MNKKHICISFFLGFILSITITAWVGISFTHLSNMKVLKALNFGYSSIVMGDERYVKDVYSKEAEFEISKYACLTYRTDANEAKWFFFRIDGTNEIVLQSLANIGAVKSEHEIPEYCENIKEHMIQKILKTSN